MARSYFAVLGVTTDASFEEIRSAYRRLAKTYHPDHFEGDSEAFRQIQEAYTVLGDAQRRKAYEKNLKSQPHRRESQPASYPGPEPLIPRRRQTASPGIAPIGVIFENPRQHFRTSRRHRSHTEFGGVEDVSVEVPLTREQAMSGGSVAIMVPAPDVCPSCRGAGSGFFHRCRHCRGSGVIVRNISVQVPFPPGLEKDHVVRVALEAFGMERFDLRVWFRVAA
ncbi:DnaJ domain-containing protein [Desulfococcus sp.]|uniref:DnaJ domain-containing protein n=1 Tax=Desulfococcus sp. TaxID=2025834 RepID=UPI003D0ED6B6